jgi:hypothetical protein
MNKVEIVVQSVNLVVLPPTLVTSRSNTSTKAEGIEAPTDGSSDPKTRYVETEQTKTRNAPCPTHTNQWTIRDISQSTLNNTKSYTRQTLKQHCCTVATPKHNTNQPASTRTWEMNHMLKRTTMG